MKTLKDYIDEKYQIERMAFIVTIAGDVRNALNTLSSPRVSPSGAYCRICGESWYVFELSSGEWIETNKIQVVEVLTAHPQNYKTS